MVSFICASSTCLINDKWKRSHPAFPCRKLFVIGKWKMRKWSINRYPKAMNFACHDAVLHVLSLFESFFWAFGSQRVKNPERKRENFNQQKECKQKGKFCYFSFSQPSSNACFASTFSSVYIALPFGRRFFTGGTRS